jgi:hypothetical protein
MAVEINRTLRLPDSEFFPAKQRKTGIAIHHTVCRGAQTAFDWWRDQRTKAGTASHIATAYIIDRDGTVFEVFDPEAWAWQFGLEWEDPERTAFEQRFIGIEIASEGGLTEHNGSLYAFDRIAPETRRSRDGAFNCPAPYRGYSWFARYQDAQLTTLGHLIDDLCSRFSIARAFPLHPFLFYDEALIPFEGVIGHAMAREDKSDPAPDMRLWEALQNLAGLKAAPLEPWSQLDQAMQHMKRIVGRLAAANAQVMARMAPGAGSLVKELLMELRRRVIALELKDPTTGGYSVGYQIVWGESETVVKVAHKLGFANVTENLLEVRHA